MYAGVVLGMLLAILRYYSPGIGFSMFLGMGDQFDSGKVSELAALDYFTEKHSSGYDGQHYAKIALDPLLLNPQGLSTEVDNLGYRARRIFPAWVAWVLGMGQPARVLQSYALENVFCWIGLSILLMRWFPPVDLDRFIRWAGILASCGLMMSLRDSLVDGPAFFLLALGWLLVEKRKRILAEWVLGAAGLSRETALFSVAGFISGGRLRWDHGRFAAFVARAFGPLVLWVFYLRIRLGPSASAGSHNFSTPLVGFVHKWCEVVSDVVVTRGADLASWIAVAPILGLTVQGVFLLSHRNRFSRRWRLGLPFVVLMLCLGDAVWEGYPGAAARVLLPMTFAFNLLVKRSTRWSFAWLILGNLSVLCAASIMWPPPAQVAVVRGPRELRVAANNSSARIEMKFDSHWYSEEVATFRAWRWSKGAASVEVNNPHSRPVFADVSLAVRALGDRTLTVLVNGVPVWSGLVSTVHREIKIPHVALPPGPTTVKFDTADGVLGYTRRNPDQRRLGIKVREFTLRLTSFGPLSTAPSDPPEPRTAK